MVEIAPDGRIKVFGKWWSRPWRGLVNGGISNFDSSVLEYLPPRPSSIEGVLFLVVAARGLLSGFSSDGFCIGSGHPKITPTPNGPSQ